MKLIVFKHINLLCKNLFKESLILNNGELNFYRSVEISPETIIYLINLEYINWTSHCSFYFRVLMNNKMGLIYTKKQFFDDLFLNEFSEKDLEFCLHGFKVIK